MRVDKGNVWALSGVHGGVDSSGGGGGGEGGGGYGYEGGGVAYVIIKLFDSVNMSI